MELEIIVKDSMPLVDLDMMPKKWLTYSTLHYKKHHSEYERYEKCLRSSRARSSDWIELNASITLTVGVKSTIFDQHNMNWRENSKSMFYIRVKAVDEHYAIAEDKKGFEVL